jgi:hypothetical protein
VSLFHTDDADSVLDHGGSHFQDQFPSIATLVAQAQVPAPDKSNQLMQGFTPMPARQDHYHITDLEDHHRFKYNLQTLLQQQTSIGLASLSVAPTPVIVPVKTPNGSYSPAP